jgi:hypothetical protein
MTVRVVLTLKIHLSFFQMASHLYSPQSMAAAQS